MHMCVGGDVTSRYAFDMADNYRRGFHLTFMHSKLWNAQR